MFKSTFQPQADAFLLFEAVMDELEPWYKVTLYSSSILPCLSLSFFLSRFFHKHENRQIQDPRLKWVPRPLPLRVAPLQVIELPPRGGLAPQPGSKAAARAPPAAEAPEAAQPVLEACERIQVYPYHGKPGGNRRASRQLFSFLDPLGIEGGGRERESESFFLFKFCLRCLADGV